MMSLEDAALMAEGRTSGGNPVFTGVSTDTRSLRPGALFVALRGERSPPLGKNACDITGVGDALDRCHHDMSSDPAETVHESGRIVHESGCDPDNQRLHFVSLRAT